MISRYPKLSLVVIITIFASALTASTLPLMMPNVFVVSQAFVIQPDGRPLSVSGEPVPPELEGLKPGAIAPFLKEHPDWRSIRTFRAGDDTRLGPPLTDVESGKGVIVFKTMRPRKTQVAINLLIFGPLVGITVFLCGVVLSFFVRRLARVAHKVLQDLKGGDLSSRLPVDKLSLFRGTAVEFNLMADAIASLMDRLRVAERGRSEIVQELAHDVRTPLTSLCLTVEDLQQRAKEIRPEELRTELGFCLSELQYLNRLIDGLLVLAQLEDPSYRFTAPIDAMEALRAEFESCKLSKENRKLSWHWAGELKEPCVILSEGTLLGRALRNLLQNAAQHARREVHVSAEADATHLTVRIRDDGNGFTGEQAARFGSRRPQRVVSASESHRISIGLGSAVARKILEGSGGVLSAGNWDRGGEVVLRVPFQPTGLRQAA